MVNHIDEIWCSDLVEMRQFSKWNKGYRYLLMDLDVFSKFGWIVPLKDKKGCDRGEKTRVWTRVKNSIIGPERLPGAKWNLDALNRE